MELIDENATQSVRRALTAGGLAAAVQELRRHVVIEDDRVALATVEALLASVQDGATRL